MFAAWTVNSIGLIYIAVGHPLYCDCWASVLIKFDLHLGGARRLLGDLPKGEKQDQVMLRGCQAMLHLQWCSGSLSDGFPGGLMGLQNDSLNAFSDSARVYNMPTVFCQSMATDRSNRTKEGMEMTILSKVKRNKRIPKYTSLIHPEGAGGGRDLGYVALLLTFFKQMAFLPGRCFSWCPTRHK